LFFQSGPFFLRVQIGEMTESIREFLGNQAQQDVVIGAADVVLAGGDDRITGSAVAVSVGVAGPSDQIFDTLSFFD
jgi:hypothetical protein